MTGYGYLAEVFDALYSGGLEELRKMHEHLAGRYDCAYWGAIQPMWLRAARRSPIVLFAVSGAVALGMWFERFMIVVGTLYRDFLPETWYHLQRPSGTGRRSPARSGSSWCRSSCLSASSG